MPQGLGPEPPFAFFVGFGRSGTTLVQSIFGAHPDLAVVHEARFVPALAGRAYGRRAGFMSEWFLRDVDRWGGLKCLGLTLEESRQALDLSPPACYPDAVRRLFELFAHSQGKLRYGDKTPSYVRSMPLLADLFPEARFVHVIRDGRDAVLAHVHRGFSGQDLPALAARWKERVTQGRQAGTQLGSTRYCEIRYEDLLDRPGDVLPPACDLLDLAYEDQMLQFFEQGDDLVAATRHPSDFDNLRRPLTRGLRDWRTEMSPPDAAQFESIAGDVLTDLGYELLTREGSRACVHRDYPSAGPPTE